MRWQLCDDDDKPASNERRSLALVAHSARRRRPRGVTLIAGSVCKEFASSCVSHTAVIMCQRKMHCSKSAR